MGNVYMEADQVRFKDSTYRDVQAALAAALEGGGGGGTTVVANPEGSATADLAKLQVGETIYGIPAEAGDISYDNTASGMTADDVQEAIDELDTDLGTLSTTIGDSSAGLVKDVADIQGLIPSGATTSNKLATASDIPDAVTGNPSGSATAGDLTKLQIGSGIYNVPSGGGSGAAVNIASLLNTSASQVGTVTINSAYRVGKVCYVFGVIAAPASATDYSGKTIFTIDNSIAPIIDARF